MKDSIVYGQFLLTLGVFGIKSFIQAWIIFKNNR